MNLIKNLFFCSFLCLFLNKPVLSSDIGFGLVLSPAYTIQTIQVNDFDALSTGGSYPIGLGLNTAIAEKLDLQVVLLANFSAISSEDMINEYFIEYESSNFSNALTLGLKLPAYVIFKFSDYIGVTAGAIVDFNLLKWGYDVVEYDFNNIPHQVNTIASYDERLIVPSARIGLALDLLDYGWIIELYYARDLINRSSNSNLRANSNFIGISYTSFY